MTKNIKGIAQLSAEQYQVCWQRGTEAPFSGRFLYHKEQGIYTCLCCERELFKSNNKFESGCGWPSFDQAIDEQAIRYLDDSSHGMSRVEVRCGECDSHLGHVFDDGPTATGKRYCINSIALEFKPQA